MNGVYLGGTYRHYKGKNYKVIAIGKHSETLDDLVVYECLYPNKISKIWCRPLEMFIDNIEIDGNLIKRFEHIG